MTVTVRLFASLRERAGADRLELELADGAKVGDLLDEMRRTVPAVAGAGRIAVAVNSEYVQPSHALAHGDEVALIPPVSGGATPARTPAGRASHSCSAPARGE